ncbi:uncharacterized protein OCT59_019570 [Rhizophagus irregularis]|uniref:uncharacterized protein n=1 Tax=Rhizophagus irregularis TaxID=588596 RepID=UPI00331F0866|nr:hypothetical protein OCT59_019570 [Rhizophagus irregularis]
MCRTELLVSASRLWIFQIGINFRTLDLIGFMFLDFNRYRFNFFGFKLVSALGLRFWIGIDFGFLDLIGIGSGSLGFGLVGFASLNISDRTLDFGSVSTSDPWFYTLNRLISFEYWMNDFFRILDG